MEKSWISILVLWIIVHVVLFASGFYDNPLYFVGRMIIGLVFITVMYKAFKTPFPMQSKDVRKSSKDVFNKTIERGFAIGASIAGCFFFLLLAARVLSSFELALVSVFGFIASLAYCGLYSLYLEHRRMFRVVSILLLILLLIFPMAFVSQLNGWIRLASYFSIMFYGVIMAFYGGIMSIIYFPKLIATVMQKNMKAKRKK